MLTIVDSICKNRILYEKMAHKPIFKLTARKTDNKHLYIKSQYIMFPYKSHCSNEKPSYHCCGYWQTKNCKN